jgi:hypothetical protein
VTAVVSVLLMNVLLLSSPRHHQMRSTVESTEKGGTSLPKDKLLSKTAPVRMLKENHGKEDDSLILSSKEEEILNTIRFRRKQEQVLENQFSPYPPVKPRSSSSSLKNQMKQVNKQTKRVPSFNDEDDFVRPSSGTVLYNHSINNLGQQP